MTKEDEVRSLGAIGERSGRDIQDVVTEIQIQINVDREVVGNARVISGDLAWIASAFEALAGTKLHQRGAGDHSARRRAGYGSLRRHR